MSKLSEHRVVKQLKMAAVEHGEGILPSQFLHSHEVPTETIAWILRYWTILRKEAGLNEVAARLRRPKYTRDDLLAEYDRVLRKLGRAPTWLELNRHSSMSYQTFRARIGKMADLKRAHRTWADLNRRAAEGDEEACQAVIRNATANRTLGKPFDVEEGDDLSLIFAGEPPGLLVAECDEYFRKKKASNTPEASE